MIIIHKFVLSSKDFLEFVCVMFRFLIFVFVDRSYCYFCFLANFSQRHGFCQKLSQILVRGTDWCFDLARLAAVILDCIGLTSRFVFVANPNKAYHGHVLLEVYYNNSWGVVDPLYGYVFYDKKPTSAKEILFAVQLQKMDEDYINMFKQIAISEYNPNDPDNKYIVSKCNEYTYKLNTIKQDGTWLLGEEKYS